MSDLTSNQLLDEAFQQVYKRRQNDSHNSDIWALSLHWSTLRNDIRDQLLQGRYPLSPVQLFDSKDAGRLTRWSAQDAVLLKAFALLLGSLLDKQIDPRCTHLKGRGGLKGACRSLRANQGRFRYVFKSDVASFYDSMNHDIVMEHAKTVLQDVRLLALLHQYLNCVEVHQGNHRLIEHGIPKGCPLSPLMGGLLLKSLDDSIREDHYYVRYMDDWVILSKTRHQLRRVVKQMYQLMARLTFKLALDKTFIGKISAGFDFLGYRFSSQGMIGLARKTVINFTQRLSRLYESGAPSQRVAQYIKHWMQWCVAGI